MTYKTIIEKEGEPPVRAVRTDHWLIQIGNKTATMRHSATIQQVIEYIDHQISVEKNLNNGL